MLLIFSGGNVVLGLHQAAGVVLRGNMTQLDVVRQHAEERNPLSNQHRHSRDDEALDEAAFSKGKGKGKAKAKADCMRAAGDQQIPGCAWNDSQKAKSNSKRIYGDPSLQSRMTMLNEQQQARRLRQVRGVASSTAKAFPEGMTERKKGKSNSKGKCEVSFPALDDDGFWG